MKGQSTSSRGTARGTKRTTGASNDLLGPTKRQARASGTRHNSRCPYAPRRVGRLRITDCTTKNQNDCIHITPSPTLPASLDLRPALHLASGSRAAAPSHRPAPCRCEGREREKESLHLRPYVDRLVAFFKARHGVLTHKVAHR